MKTGHGRKSNLLTFYGQFSFSHGIVCCHLTLWHHQRDITFFSNEGQYMPLAQPHNFMAQWPWKYQPRSKVITCDTASCPLGKIQFYPSTHPHPQENHTHAHTHTHTLSISLSHGVQHHLTLSFSPHTTSMLCHHNLVCDHPRQLTCSLWFVGRSLTRCHHHQYHLPVPQWGFPSQQASLLKNNVKLWTTVFWYQMLHRWVNARKTSTPLLTGRLWYRDHSGYGLSQCEEALQCNTFPQIPYPEWSL